MTTPKLLRVSDVAERLTLSPSKVYELVESGALSHHKIGGAIRVSEEQLTGFLEGTKRERQEQTPCERKPHRSRVVILKHL